MRNIRFRRRLKVFLIILLAASFIAFFESRIEAFAPQFRVFASDKIGLALGGKVDIAIGSLEGGLIRPFTLRDVQVAAKGGKTHSKLVEINNIVSNYRIWNFIFPRFLSKEPYIAIDFVTRDQEVAGFVVIKGAIENASIKGHIKLLGGEKIDITGRIKNDVASLILMPEKGIIKAECNFAADGVLLLKIKLSHFKVRDIDITGEIIIRNIIAKNSIDARDNSIEGELEAKGLILNYKPFNDIKASYRISKETLELSNLDFGRICYINGRFGLREPHLVNATAVTDNVNIGQAFSIFNARYGSFVQGTMNSKWEFKGPAGNLKSKIRLEIKKGRIADMDFEFLSANLKGDGPVISIEDSRITRENGSFTLAGDMDLKRIGKDSLFENLKITDGENTVLWDGYDTAKWQDVREFRMKKKITEGIDIGFKQFVNDDKVDESLKERDVYELSYKLHPNDSLKVKFSDNKNFFGVEHKDKF